MEIIAFIVVSYFVIRYFRAYYKTSKETTNAAMPIKNLLDIQKKLGTFDGKPDESAMRFVLAAYEADITEAIKRFGTKPHKLSVVIFSLSLAVQSHAKSKSLDTSAIFNAFCEALSEAEVNGASYALTAIDNYLINKAIKMQGNMEAQMQEVYPIAEKDWAVLDNVMKEIERNG